MSDAETAEWLRTMLGKWNRIVEAAEVAGNARLLETAAKQRDFCAKRLREAEQNSVLVSPALVMK